MIRLSDILDRVRVYNPHADIELINRAYVYTAKAHAGAVRLSGEPYLVHPLEVTGILSEMKMVAEGVQTTRSVLALARRHRISMPIVEEVHAVLFEDKDPRLAVADLMTRGAKSEIEDFESPGRKPAKRRGRGA